MPDPPADDRNAVGLDGDFLTVEQMAQLRRVTPAAIRAQLRAGSLAGEQVLQGQRTVWRIPVGAARRSVEGPGGTSTRAESGPAGTPTRPPASARPSAPVTPSDAAPARPAPGSPASAAPPPAPVPAPAPVPSATRVESLESEVRRLRGQLSALAEAHRRLLDALTADLADDSPR
jgi:hypothetical protein